jgi:hypothetical protein
MCVLQRATRAILASALRAPFCGRATRAILPARYARHFANALRAPKYQHTTCNTLHTPSTRPVAGRYAACGGPLRGQ